MGLDARKIQRQLPLRVEVTIKVTKHRPEVCWNFTAWRAFQQGIEYGSPMEHVGRESRYDVSDDRSKRVIH